MLSIILTPKNHFLAFKNVTELNASVINVILKNFWALTVLSNSFIHSLSLSVYLSCSFFHYFPSLPRSYALEMENYSSPSISF
jgi:hypothetical protein